MKIRGVIAAAAVILTLLLSLDILYLPVIKSNEAANFSAERVKRDIEIISQKPHSIEHPVERAEVRDYLAQRLTEIGLKVSYFKYDSIVDRFGIHRDIANLYGVCEPPGSSAGSYVMLMAHMDSRFANKVKDRVVYSYGAADDGYGLGSILELASLALNYRDSWSQGLKILFTDSEESDLEGIRYALKNDSRIFDNVGLIINIEARGVRGPAALFETSSGNEAVIDLYSKSVNPFAFSLTSAVYKILPNYTDFSLIKDSYPGMNFAVIDDLNHYHTHLDNFDNISLRSIQHYGNQIEPVLKEYLVNSKYKDPRYLVKENDTVYFTVPYLGLFRLSRVGYLSVKTVLLILFALSSALFLKQGRISFKKLFPLLFLNITFLALISGVGYLLSVIFANFNNLDYKLINLAHIGGDKIIALSLTLFSLALYTLFYLKFIKSGRFTPIHFLWSAIFLIYLLSIISLFLTGDSVLFFVAVIPCSLIFVLRIFIFSRLLSLWVVLITLLFVAPLLISLYAALAFGALCIIIPLVILFVWILTPVMHSFISGDI